MIGIILNKKNIPYFIIAVLLLYILLIGKKEKTEVLIPSVENSFEVKDPEPITLFDTIYKIRYKEKEVIEVVPIENPVNKELLQKYNEAVKAKDSLLQLKLHSNAITERTYSERFEDSVQVITVKSSVIGTLKKQTVDYKTKPKTIIVSSGRTRPNLYFGGFVTSQVIDKIELKTVGVKLELVGKKTIISAGFDNEKNITLGIGKKLF